MTPCPKTTAVRLKGKAKTAFRRQVYEHFRGICQACGTFAPLRDAEGQMDVFSTGHIAHLKSRGAGGSDILENVTWKCPVCHLQKEHGLKWSASL